MAALLDVDLEEVAQVVERGRGQPEMALLLDWGADGIITDRVSTLEQLLTDRGDPRPTGD